MNVGDLCQKNPVTVRPFEDLIAVAQLMREKHVGYVVVVEPAVREGAFRPAGVLTDRDIAIRCVAGRADPSETSVEELMSTPPQAVDEHTPIEDAVSRMADLGLRRLVVTGENNRVVGILSLDDVLDQIVQQTRAIGKLLKQQKPGILA